MFLCSLLLYINDLLNIIADPSKLILFADETSIINTNPSPSKFKEDVNNIIDNINDWFRGNSLSIIFIKPTSYNLGLKIVRKVI